MQLLVCLGKSSQFCVLATPVLLKNMEDCSTTMHTEEDESLCSGSESAESEIE